MLRDLRLAAGLTQAELAEKASVADATVSRIERGRLTPSVKLVQQLAEVLGTSVDILLSSKALPKKPPMRRCEARLLALVRDMDDAAVDDVTKSLKALLGVGKRMRRG